jgi:hypothetical protein
VDERPKEPPRPRATGSADGDARKISAALAERIEELCHALLPNGVKHGCEWDVGSLNGEAGKSLRVHLSGEKAGVWSDFATGGDRGDALELVKATKSYSSVEAMDWARSWLGWPTREPPPQGAKKNTAPGNGPTCSDWPDPKPLPSGLALVDAFNLEFLPDTFAPWIGDISDRLQCPTDYAAIAAIVSFGSVLGRRIGVKPQFKTDWYEVPNLWGCFIGRPGQLKSPAMTEALKPIHRLEAEALKQNEIDQKAYAQGLSAYKIKREVAASLAKKELKQTGKMGDLKFDLDEEPEEPLPTRYRTNDSSYEAIGELLISNPTGILVERDELVSLLMNLDREDQASARGFYLSAWSGKSPYTFDRIVRGHRHIEGACISVLGNTQPARIAEYIRRANVGGAGGDGLIQRFGLMVWPDAPPTWRDVDEYPNPAARERVWQAFERVSKIDLTAALKLGAERGTFDPLPALRFDEAAQAVFREWRSELEERDLRSGKLSPALEGHLAKFRKLVPVLSLINHLADGNEGRSLRERCSRHSRSPSTSRAMLAASMDRGTKPS